jgi:pyruvate formate-lyase activating enzyme-like uncharacterized protein
MDTLEQVAITGLQGVQVPVQTVELIMYVERLFYNRHVEDIRARQDKIAGMWQDDNRFLAFWFPTENHKFGEIKDIIAPGCYACLFSTISHIRHSYKCTQNCDFCYYASPKSEMGVPPIGKGLYNFSGSKMSFTLDETIVLLDRQAGVYGAIGWLQKEPLEELDAIEPVMKEIAKRGYHQYMYTNGVKATNKVIDKLVSWGLNELRFNLQATDFDTKIIDRIKYAKKKNIWTLIETPMFSRSYNNFIKHKERILDTGLCQINVPELQICAPDLIEHFEKTEGPVYKHRRGYVSPISSRHYTYDLIERAEAENWNVIINDCSNDTKFIRGANEKTPMGVVLYDSVFELPFRNVAYLANEVLEDGVTYEFF